MKRGQLVKFLAKIPVNADIKFVDDDGETWEFERGHIKYDADTKTVLICTDIEIGNPYL